MKWLEVSAALVDRGVDPAQSSTVGIVRFNYDDPDAPPETNNPFDYRTVGLLKAYFDGLWAEYADVTARVNAAS